MDTLVYLIDDEFSVRDSLTLVLESVGLRVKSFESAEDFLKNYNNEYPSCLILDVKMPCMSGLELQEELLKRNISIPIIFISGHAGISQSAKAFRAGAVDFLEKPFDHEVLLARITEVIQKNIEYRWRLNVHFELANRHYCLTEREREVLTLISEGSSNKEAANLLGISSRTVEAHRARIMKKMEVDSFVDLVMLTHFNILNERG
ncbi:MAG: response regulator [Methylococcales bacterium]|nr:response regulator [Methylococcales bacterium]